MLLQRFVSMHVSRNTEKKNEIVRKKKKNLHRKAHDARNVNVMGKQEIEVHLQRV